MIAHSLVTKRAEAGHNECENICSINMSVHEAMVLGNGWGEAWHDVFG